MLIVRAQAYAVTDGAVIMHNIVAMTNRAAVAAGFMGIAVSVTCAATMLAGIMLIAYTATKFANSVDCILTLTGNSATCTGCM